ncbi:hypothetical protein JOC76_004789 [Neobacillus cucumis]|nr:hypothetical protein [Neobacillus cucumis]
MTKMFQLSNDLEVSNSAHILYFFEDHNSYLNNMIAYIKAGIERNHHLLIIENKYLYNEAEKKINQLFSKEAQKFIHYIDNYLFYRCYGDFHIHSIVEHFGEILTPFFNEKMNIRTWAHVEWKEQDDISSKLEEFEHLADCSVNESGLMSVCAYSASDVSASLQTGMMKSHEYLMTDQEFVRSSLYRK